MHAFHEDRLRYAAIDQFYAQFTLSVCYAIGCRAISPHLCGGNWISHIPACRTQSDPITNTICCRRHRRLAATINRQRSAHIWLLDCLIVAAVLLINIWYLLRKRKWKAKNRLCVLVVERLSPICYRTKLIEFFCVIAYLFTIFEFLFAVFQCFCTATSHLVLSVARLACCA